MDRFIGIVLCIYIKNNRILVGKRRDTGKKNKPYIGFWDVPGGKIEYNDKDIESAVKREFKEETGLLIKRCEPLRYFMFLGADIPPFLQPAFFFPYRIEEVEGNLRAESDLEELSFKSVNELKKLETTPWLRRILESELPSFG